MSNEQPKHRADVPWIVPPPVRLAPRHVETVDPFAQLLHDITVGNPFRRGAGS